MNTFQKYLPALYYALLGVLAVCLLGLGLADTQNSGDSYRKNPSFDTERAFGDVTKLASRSHYAGTEEQAENTQYLLDELAKLGYTEESGSVVVKRHEVIYNGADKEIRDTYPIANIYVKFPGTAPTLNGDTLLIMAHYDSVAMGPGAGDDTSSAASMLETVRQIGENGLSFRNNVIFFFSDSEERGLDGSKFGVQEDLNVSEIKLVANFECRGTGGSQIMFESSKGNSKLIRELKKIDGGFYTNSIANFVYNVMPNYTDLTTFMDAGTMGLNFANIGEGYNYHTQNDNTENLDLSYLNQVGTTMGSVVEHFGNLNLTALQSKSNAVFFNYLDWFTVSYNSIFALVMGIVTLGVFAAVFVVNRDTKAYSYKKFGVGAAVLLIALVLTVLLLMLLNLVLKMFGVYGVMANSGLYASVPMFLAVLLFTAAINMLVYHFFGKLLKTDGRHIVLAGACLIGLIGSVLSFVLPEVSFLFLWTGFFAGVGCLLNTVFGEKGGLHRLALPLIGLVVTIPIVVGVLMLAGDALGAKMYPYIGALAAVYLSLVLPQAAQMEFSVKKVRINRFAVIILMGVTAFSLLLADGIASPAKDFSANLSGHRTEYYDDTLTFVKEADGGSYAYLYDYDIYPFVKGQLGKFTRQEDKTYRLNTENLAAQNKAQLSITREARDGHTYYTYRVTGLGEVVDLGRQALFTVPVGEGVAVSLDGYPEFIPYTGGAKTVDVRVSKDTDVVLRYTGSVTHEGQVTLRELVKDKQAVEEAVGGTEVYRASGSVARLKVMLELRANAVYPA